MDLKETKSTVVTTIISSEDGRNTYEIRKEIMEGNGEKAVEEVDYDKKDIRIFTR